MNEEIDEKKHKHKETEEKEKIEEIVETKNDDAKMEDKGEEKTEIKKDEKKSEEKIEKKETKKHEKPKKTEAVVNGLSLHMSTKTAGAISKFIRGKEIQKAISELEEVAKLKRAIPMKGEFPHRRGKMMSGKFPQKSARIFIKLLKSLLANANFLGIENPIVSEAVSNIAPRPYGKFGSVRRKRTHVKLVARSVGAKK